MMYISLLNGSHLEPTDCSKFLSRCSRWSSPHAMTRWQIFSNQTVLVVHHASCQTANSAKKSNRINNRWAAKALVFEPPTLFLRCYVGLALYGFVECNPVKQWESPCRPWAKIDSYPKHVQKTEKYRKVGHLFFSEFWSPKIASIKTKNKWHMSNLCWSPIFQLQTP